MCKPNSGPIGGPTGTLGTARQSGRSGIDAVPHGSSMSPARGVPVMITLWAAAVPSDPVTLAFHVVIADPTRRGVTSMRAVPAGRGPNIWAVTLRTRRSALCCCVTSTALTDAAMTRPPHAPRP